jgi:hypothetical protein
MRARHQKPFVGRLGEDIATGAGRKSGEGIVARKALLDFLCE